jgi:TRAP-type mannitol/chloroaromatic compound transport system substrate-binding protein
MKLKFLAAVLAIAASAQAFAQRPIVIKFSHVVAPDTPKGQAAERFKQLAEKFTGGRVKVDVYPNSQLYKDNDEMEALQLGAVQMLAPSLAKFGRLGVREFEAFDLPYIFPSKTALYNVTEGDIGKGLLKKLESRGITGLAYWDNGFKVMSANKPLRTPADVKGLKMRIQLSSANARAGRVSASAGIFRSDAGAENRRGRWHRKSAIEHVHAKDARSTKAHDGDEPWLPGLRGDRPQEVLGWAAGRYPQRAGKSHEGSHRL